MSLRTLRAAVDGLPQSVQRRVLDYGTFINEAATDIFDQANVSKPTASEVDDLVLVAGLRKLWALVEFQRDTLIAITTSDSYGFEGVVARGTYYTRQSREVRELNEMSEELRAVLVTAEVMPLIQMRTLYDVARALRSA